jgi:hypothetical protein
MWPPRSPNMTSCDFYLWDMLKDRVYGMKSSTEAELKENIRNTAFSISPAERRRATTCFFCDACLGAEKNHSHYVR